MWGGTAVAMSPSPTGRHAKLLGRVVASLTNAIEAAGCDATVLVEIDWIVTRDTVVRPDVTVVCGAEPEGHVEQAPALIVEILSQATRERDAVFKKALYRDQGVRWYLLVDPDAATLLSLRLSDDGDYEARGPGPAGSLVEIDLCSGCRLTVEPAGLFR